MPQISYVAPVETGSNSSGGNSSAGKLTNLPSEYYKYKKSKNIWLVSALVTGAVGTFAYLQTGTAYDQYKTTTTNDATNLYDKAKLYNMIAPIALGIAGFSTLEFILKSGKQRKAKNQSLSLYPVNVKDGGGFGIAYHF